MLGKFNSCSHGKTNKEETKQKKKPPEKKKPILPPKQQNSLKPNSDPQTLTVMKLY